MQPSEPMRLKRWRNKSKNTPLEHGTLFAVRAPMGPSFFWGDREKGSLLLRMDESSAALLAEALR
jgi:hypothetical protein